MLVQGEGRALAAAKDFMLGEHLPDLHLVPKVQYWAHPCPAHCYFVQMTADIQSVPKEYFLLQDICGNALEAALPELQSLTIDVATHLGDDEDAAPAALHDLQAQYEVLHASLPPSTLYPHQYPAAEAVNKILRKGN